MSEPGLIPDLDRRERALQRFNLANAAALRVPVRIEGEQTFRAHECLHGVRLRKERVDRDAVMRADLLDELIGLRMQPSRVEREHLEGQPRLDRHVDEHDVFCAAEGDRQIGRVLLEGQPNDCQWMALSVLRRHRWNRRKVECHLVTVPPEAAEPQE